MYQSRHSSPSLTASIRSARWRCASGSERGARGAQVTGGGHAMVSVLREAMGGGDIERGRARDASLFRWLAWRGASMAGDGETMTFCFLPGVDSQGGSSPASH